MGELFILIYRIIRGEKLEKSTKDDFQKLWFVGIVFALFCICFHFKLLNKLPDPETYFAWLIFIFLYILVLLLIILGLLLIPRKILTYLGCLGWALIVFILLYNIYIN